LTLPAAGRMQAIRLVPAVPASRQPHSWEPAR
jgi:hypothetical protein